MKYIFVVLAALMICGSAFAQGASDAPEARLQTLEAQIEALKAEIEDVKASLTDPEGAVPVIKEDVNKLKKFGFSGYVQGRYERYEDGTQGAVSTNKDGFFVRRARLKLTANPKPRTSAVVYFDADRGVAGVKEAYVEYIPQTKKQLGPWFRLGQFLWPFGYEVWEQSSSVRETPERAIVNRRFFDGERDRGLLVGGPLGGKTEWVIGLVNGAGVKTTPLGESANSNTQDDNRHRDIVGRVKFHTADNLDIGISGYVGKAVATPAPDFSETSKNRWGADIQYYMDRASIKAEYIQGDLLRKVGSAVQSSNAKGWWAQLAYNLNPTNVLVAKYDQFDDGVPTSSTGLLSAWNLGLIRYLDEDLRLKLFYEINREQRNSVDNNGLRVELITKF